LNVGGGVRIDGGYSMERLETSSGVTSDAHFITLGVSKLF
jgi:hypothetical protein